MSSPMLQIAMPLPEGKVYQHIEFGPDNVLAASFEGMVHLISADKGGELCKPPVALLLDCTIR